MQVRLTDKWRLLTAGVVALTSLMVPVARAAAESSNVKKEIDIVEFGDTRSDVAHRAELLRAFEDVVLPGVAERRATLVIALVTDTSSTEPVVVASESFDVSQEAGGNPLLADKLIAERKSKVLGALQRALAHRKPAPASAWFAGASWAAQEFHLYARSRKVLYLLGDAADTSTGCASTSRDLAAANLGRVLESCTTGHTPDLRRVLVVQGGAGTGDLPVATALGLERLWRAYWSQTGASLRCYAATLLTDCIGADS